MKENSRTRGERHNVTSNSQTRTWLLIKQSNMVDSKLPSGIHSLAMNLTNISTAVSSITLGLIAGILSRLELLSFSLRTTIERS